MEGKKTNLPAPSLRFSTRSAGTSPHSSLSSCENNRLCDKQTAKLTITSALTTLNLKFGFLKLPFSLLVIVVPWLHMIRSSEARCCVRLLEAGSGVCGRLESRLSISRTMISVRYADLTMSPSPACDGTEENCDGENVTTASFGSESAGK